MQVTSLVTLSTGVGEVGDFHDAVKKKNISQIHGIIIMSYNDHQINENGKVL